MHRLALLIALLAADVGCSKILGLNDVTSGEPPRLIAPLSMSTVTQQKPTLHWVLGTMKGTPVVELCADRTCAVPLPVTTQLAGDHLSAAPASALSAGWVFWRVRVVSGSQTVSSATWQFWVGKSSASTPVDTSNGAILDVNGDGFPDLLVGAYGTGSGTGTAHVYLGSATASVTDWNTASAARRIDLVSPDDASASFGYAVSSAGDVNGDGYADFLVGAFGADSEAGRVHLYLGSATPGPDSWNGSSAAGRVDLINAGHDGTIFGAAVAGAGDVNGDGYADFLVGAAKAGAAHLYLGTAKPSASDWNAGGSARRIDLAGPEASSAFGSSVAGVGDVNGDGYADLLIGADAAGAGSGAAYLYLGSATPGAAGWSGVAASARIDLTDPDDAGASFGSAVASAGDVNGDGYADFLVGARSAGAVTGAAHLYLGSAQPGAADWNGTSPARRTELVTPDGASAVFGSSVAGAGDVNGDGYGDFLVGAEGLGAGAGAVHLYLGAPRPDATAWNGSPGGGRIDLANPDGAGARFGTAVACAGDVNGDGYIDFVVGARNVGSLGGAAQLYLGSATPGAAAWNGASSAARVDLTNPAGPGARFGVSVASAEARPRSR